VRINPPCRRLCAGFHSSSLPSTVRFHNACSLCAHTCETSPTRTFVLRVLQLMELLRKRVTAGFKGHYCPQSPEMAYVTVKGFPVIISDVLPTMPPCDRRTESSPKQPTTNLSVLYVYPPLSTRRRVVMDATGPQPLVRIFEQTIHPSYRRCGHALERAWRTVPPASVV
jgi:hypothetical protein